MWVLSSPGVYRPQGDTYLLEHVLKRSGVCAGLDVLDVGTGTGALAMVAARCGARSVTAVDVSARAVLTAWVNARISATQSPKPQRPRLVPSMISLKDSRARSTFC
nr:50S ribosomal protein L11 methyltransferase [Saccharopolyspora flava]